MPACTPHVSAGSSPTWSTFNLVSCQCTWESSGRQLKCLRTACDMEDLEGAPGFLLWYTPSLAAVVTLGEWIRRQRFCFSLCLRVTVFQISQYIIFLFKSKLDYVWLEDFKNTFQLCDCMTEGSKCCHPLMCFLPSGNAKQGITKGPGRRLVGTPLPL